ncbi:hypothetical protein [Bacillus suaedae]|uniref:Uncharacterized protein n=1 Tax=Halalkalibacter suaedae TaxID=2822140 RepID=A0A940WRT5_9BACI|nr:hypothetical protein [Bacillus suaedae]MBP3951320.1 hypothetical protein [Bacillus suaedae]
MFLFLRIASSVKAIRVKRLLKHSRQVLLDSQQKGIMKNSVHCTTL